MAVIFKLIHEFLEVLELNSTRVNYLHVWHFSE